MREKKEANVQVLSSYIASWIEAKLKRPEINEGYVFGHDWNSMFPRGITVPEYGKNTIYCAISIVFREIDSIKDLPEKRRYLDGESMVTRLITFLKDDNLEAPWWAGESNYRSAAFIIYYVLRNYQEFCKNQE